MYISQIICHNFFFCNFTFDCCSIYNSHTSCSCLHNTIIYVYSLILQMSFCFLTLRFINTVREHIIYKIHKIAFAPPPPPPPPPMPLLNPHPSKSNISCHLSKIICLFARGSIDSKNFFMLFTGINIIFCD